jgi:amino acid transporter
MAERGPAELAAPGGGSTATRAWLGFKRLLVGRPRSSHEMGHTLLPKYLALPLFSSDPLSSVAYATQEIIVVLAAAGTAALGSVVPISVVVAILLVVVTTSYRQACHAYPRGGGSYAVASQNLGHRAGLLAASALMCDYVMTAAVSSAAGVDAITSAIPALHPYSVIMAVALVAAVTLMNLRGVRESGRVFAAPTYLFVAAVFATIAAGFLRCAGGCPKAPPPPAHVGAGGAIGLFLILQAFAAGTTALTGVEAIANGVPAFKEPRPQNAARTLTMMAVIAVGMFEGISILANLFHVFYRDGMQHTVLAQIALTAWGRGAMFYVVQAATAFVLILAANTAFNGFPRLAAVMSDDRFLPRQFGHLGDRLNYSNGIIIIAVAAVGVIIGFDANVNAMIHLYLIGVFIAFTLSQSGLVRFWAERRSELRWWWGRAGLNATGALLTGSVLAIAIVTKFLQGAWIVILAIPILMYAMSAVRRHYGDVERQVALPKRAPRHIERRSHHLAVYIDDMDTLSVGALNYVRSFEGADLRAVTLDAEEAQRWSRVAEDIPVTLLDGEGSRRDKVREYLVEARKSLGPADFLTLVVPEETELGSVIDAIRHPALQVLKAEAVAEPRIEVMNLAYQTGDLKPKEGQVKGTVTNRIVILVDDVDNAVLRALEYATSLGTSEVRGMHIAFDQTDGERVRRAWVTAGIDHPLDVMQSPFRSFSSSLLSYVHGYHVDGTDSFVTLLVPEYVMDKKRHRLLHSQTPLLVKRNLYGKRGCVVVSVPFHVRLEDVKEADREAERAAG